MDQRCAECSAPVVEGFDFCGSCGALVAGAATSGPVGEVQPAAEDGEQDVGPGPAGGSTGAAQGADRPSAAEGPARRRAVVAVTTILAVAAALLRFGAPDAPVPAMAPPPAEGGGRAVEVDLPGLAGVVAWEVAGAQAVDVAGPFPWAAPTLTDRHVVLVQPGAVWFVDRDARSGGRVRIDLPVTGRSSPAVLDHEVSRVAIVADGSLWVVEPDGVAARSVDDDVADVTPLALGADAVLVEGELGDLRRLVHRADVFVSETSRIRGVDIEAPDGAVPRFELAVRALADGDPWVASRTRGRDEWSLRRLHPQRLAVEVEVALGADVPSVLGLPGGGVALASGDVVRVLERDGTPRWSQAPGEGAEVLGLDGDLLLVRHATGRIVYDVEDARSVARATLGLVEGARSAAAGGEVIAFDGVSLAALRIRDATVSRRLDGRALSIAGQDDALLAWVVAGARGESVLRLLPTPDRAPARAGEQDARDVVLAAGDRCRLAGAGDRVVWHDGASLREVDLADGRVLATVASASTAGSSVVVQGDRTLLVDERGVVRTWGRGLEPGVVLPIGDDPIGGVAPAGDLVVVGGGTGRQATLTSTSGYLRGVRGDGGSAWLVRTPESVVSPPAARGGAAAVRQEDGGVVLVQDGVGVAVVAADRRSLDPPVVDERGLVLRDGADVVAVFPQGEEAWRAVGVGARPAPASDGDLVVVATPDGLVALDRATGARRWQADLGATPLGPATIVGGSVVAVLPDSLLVMDRATGEVVDQVASLPALAGPIVATSTGVVTCSADGRLLLVT